MAKMQKEHFILRVSHLQSMSDTASKLISLFMT